MKAFVIFGVHIEKVIFRRFLVNLLLQCTSAVLGGPTGAHLRIYIYTPYIFSFSWNCEKGAISSWLRNASETDLIQETTACGRRLLHEQKYMQLLLPYAKHINGQNLHFKIRITNLPWFN